MRRTLCARFFHFTEQLDASALRDIGLETSQGTMRGNMWVEAKEAKHLGIAVKSTARPTPEVWVRKSFELYNGDQFIQTDAFHREQPTQHCNMFTKKIYTPRIASELQGRCDAKGWTSKFWVSKGAIRANGLQLLSSEASKRNLVPMMYRTSLYHASDLANPADLLTLPLRGFQKSIITSNSHEFKTFQQAHKFSTCCFYTNKQLANLGLQSRANESPLVVDVPVQQAGFGSSRNTDNNTAATGASSVKYYHLSQVNILSEELQSRLRDCQVGQLRLTINRISTTNKISDPQFEGLPPLVDFLTLSRLRPTDAENVQEIAKKLASQDVGKPSLWVNAQDVAQSNGQILTKPSVDPITCCADKTLSMEWFNIDQLANPIKGFQLAGVVTM